MTVGEAARAQVEERAAPAAPSVLRRMACFIYEGVLLFGVLMIAGYLFGTLTQQRHALYGRHGLQFFLFIVLGIYFVWFWSRGGQTVARKAWHIRLVRQGGAPVSQGRATVRYLLSWAWFLPALTAIAVLNVHRPGEVAALLLVGLSLYAALSWLHPRRQFVHDVLCGTELVTSQQTSEKRLARRERS